MVLSLHNLGSRPCAVDFTWGNDNWRAVLWGKVTIVNMILQLGYDLVLSDTDVVWFKNPLQVFADFPTVRPRLSPLCLL